MENNVRDVVQDASLSGLEALDFYIEAYFAAFRGSNTYQAYFTFLSGAVADRSELLPLFADSHERVKSRIAELIERGLADGSMSQASDPEEGALIIGSLMMGVSIQALIDPGLDLTAMERQTRTMLAARFAA